MRLDRDAKKLLAATGRRAQGFNLQQADQCREKIDQLRAVADAAQQEVIAGELDVLGKHVSTQDHRVAALAAAHADIAIEAMLAIASLGLEPSAVMDMRKRERLGEPVFVSMADYVRGRRVLAAARGE